MVDRTDEGNRSATRRASIAPHGFTEDELVATIRKLLAGDAPGVELGIGDDAALVDMGDRLAILTTDMLVEGVHFRRTIAPRDLGYKAIAVNVSDVAAMGGSPRYGLVSVGLAEDEEIGWIVELYGGVRDAAAEYGMAVVGGDTSRADRIVDSRARDSTSARRGQRGPRAVV